MVEHWFDRIQVRGAMLAAGYCKLPWNVSLFEVQTPLGDNPPLPRFTRLKIKEKNR
jgi:hypothetical protein